MAFKSFHYLKDFSCILLSSILLVLSFPSFDLGLFAWVGLVPLLLVVNGKSCRYGFFLTLVWSVIFFTGIVSWLSELTTYKYYHHAILGLYFGPLLGFFGLAFSFISRRWGLAPGFLAAPFLWVAVEYIRSNLSFMADPWALLAHSQYQHPAVIQVASITGTYGISFLVVMVNSTIALVMLAILNKVGWQRAPALNYPSRRGTMSVALATAALVGLALLYGQITLSRPIAGEEIKVTVVQGNIEQKKKWDRRYARFIMQTYADLTRKASEDKPALIIWPETATPRSISRDHRLHGEVRRIAQEAGTPLLLGSAQHQKFGRKGMKRFKYLNSAFLIPPRFSEDKFQRYDKIRLLPFGEYLPLQGTVPWSYIEVPAIGGYVPGKEHTVFELSPFRFGVTICWENIFPDLFRRFVKGGAQVMINITNEAWFGKTAAPYQFVAMSIFRAVENRIFVIRSANTGVSCFIDPYGRIVGRVKDADGQDIFVRGLLTESVIPLESKTFYTRYGDWLAWMCFPCSAAFLLVAIFREK